MRFNLHLAVFLLIGCAHRWKCSHTPGSCYYIFLVTFTCMHFWQCYYTLGVHTTLEVVTHPLWELLLYLVIVDIHTQCLHACTFGSACSYTLSVHTAGSVHTPSPVIVTIINSRDIHMHTVLAYSVPIYTLHIPMVLMHAHTPSRCCYYGK